MLENIKENIKNSEFYKDRKKNSFKRNIKLRISLYKKISSLLRQSMSMKDIVGEITKAKKKENTPDYYFLRNVQIEMEKGKDFSDSIVGWVTDNELQLIRAGEKSGDLEKSFSMAIKLTLRLKEIKSRIIKETAYPIVLFIMAIVMMYGLSVSIMPALIETSNPENWPQMSKNLYLTTNFIRDNIFFIIIILIVLFFSISYSMGKLKGDIRKKLDKIPPYKLYKDIQSSIFLISLSTLLNAQVSLKESILNLKKQANPYLETKLNEMIKRIDKGYEPGQSINTEFMGSIGSDIQIYSKAADFENAMLELGEEAMEEKLESISRTMSILRFLMLILIGGIIFWVFMSFFEITSTIN